MVEEPLVTIIVPIYMVENYISETMYSIVNQTYKNYEVILVDDGSPDNSIDIAERIAKGNGVSYKIIRKENSGVARARNDGLDVAQGEWIFFIDSDDYIVPETISDMVLAARKNKVDLVFSTFERMYTDGSIPSTKESRLYSVQELRQCFLLRTKIILAPGTLFNKKFLDKYNLRYTNIPWSEDQHFIWSCLLYLGQAICLEYPYYRYRYRENSIMTSTKLEKIVESYTYFGELERRYSFDSIVGQFLRSRWVMGTLNSASRISVYDEWKKAWIEINGKKHMKQLLKFPNAKVRLLAIVGLFSTKLYYKLTRK